MLFLISSDNLSDIQSIKMQISYSHFKLFFCFIGILFGNSLHAQVRFNGNFEEIEKNGNPTGWELTFNSVNKYDVTLDSLIKRQGKFSVSISSGSSNASGDGISFKIPHTYHAKALTLIGSIKTEHVNGNAGLWLRIDGDENKVLAFEQMEKNGVTGTSGWKEYMVQIPYNENEAVTINVGAFLTGKGKMWVDSLRLYADANPIEHATVIKPQFLALTDTAFKAGSGIKSIALNKQTISNLALLGQLWGFLKYHHPVIQRGDYNWDNELFRVLPKVLKCKTNAALSDVFEKWVDKTGRPDPCTTCTTIDTVKNIALRPDYGSLFSNHVFSKPLIKKLRYILENRNLTNNYYATDNGYTYPQFPLFTHEISYGDQAYSDAGYRLLALYRYWNIIQYFYPNRHLITRNWNTILPDFIPLVVSAKGQVAYTNTILRLIASINDTHAGLFNNDALEKERGLYRLPFRAAFVQNQLVVTDYYKDTLNVKNHFRTGDVILSINGRTVNELVKKFLSVQTGSNYAAQLRDMPGNYLLRSNNRKFTFGIKRLDKILKITFTGIEISKIDFYGAEWHPKPHLLGYSLLNKNIGYVFPARFKGEDLPNLKMLFAGTKAIIIDYRCYPLDMKGMMALSSYLHTQSIAFTKYTAVSVGYPGLFRFTPPLVNDGESKNAYQGKIIVIVNEWTQSSAEFNVMALQASPNVTVIGSTTAGADGSLTNITLPGSISTGISNIGVYYPDGGQTQRVGIKVNYLIRPTINGIKNGRDELLEKARSLIN
jgi:hypothetical protein